MVVIVMGIVSLSCVVILAVVLCQVLHQYGVERKDLLDRLMSRDIAEYKQLTDSAPIGDPVDLSDEEEWMREIEMMKSGSG